MLTRHSIVMNTLDCFAAASDNEKTSSPSVCANILRHERQALAPNPSNAERQRCSWLAR